MKFLILFGYFLAAIVAGVIANMITGVLIMRTYASMVADMNLFGTPKITVPSTTDTDVSAQ